MKNGTNRGALPPLIGAVITDPKHYIDNLFADTWFGTKSMMRSALELEMCAILRMKKSKMKYRAVVKGNGTDLSLNQLK